MQIFIIACKYDINQLKIVLIVQIKVLDSHRDKFIPILRQTRDECAENIKILKADIRECGTTPNASGSSSVGSFEDRPVRLSAVIDSL